MLLPFSDYSPSIPVCCFIYFTQCLWLFLEVRWSNKAITLGSEQSLIIYYVDFHLISQILHAYLGDNREFCLRPPTIKPVVIFLLVRGSHLQFVKNTTSRNTIKRSIPVYDISILNCVRDPQSRDFTSLPSWERDPDLETLLVFCQAGRGVVHLTGRGRWIKLSD